MSEQNIYDDLLFFQGYQQLRNREDSANNMIEKPALFSLCPDVQGKTVLDLGCGCGENCQRFKESGASRVIGIDISKNMLKVAMETCQGEGMEFYQMSMSDLSALHQSFDLIVSSLAVHYIENFNQLLSDIHALLKKDGIFLFSQEHPLTTALMNDHYWTRDENDLALHYNLSHYAVEGKRTNHWIVDGVVKYHRTMSSIINALIDAGFVIEKVLEPVLDETMMEKFPNFRKSIHKPDFLLVKARKSD